MPDPDLVKRFPFTLEVKRREGWSLKAFLGGSQRGPVWQWWAQTQKAATDSGRRPMLWFRQHHRSMQAVGLPSCWLVMIEATVFARLSRLRGLALPVVRFDEPRHTVVLTHAQTLWLPPAAFVQACLAAAVV